MTPPESWPTPANLRFRGALGALEGVVRELIEARRRSGQDAGDVLSLLMSARDEGTGEPMTDRQLRDEVMNLFVGGHETAAGALAWTWYLLSKHPEVQRRPAGSTVALSQWVTHRHPQCWDNPEGFDPERFTPERSAGRPRFAYFPFGGGPRVCLGSSLAMLALPLIVATVAQRYRLELVPDHRVEPEAAITLRPRHGLLVTLRPRSL